LPGLFWEACAGFFVFFKGVGTTQRWSDGASPKHIARNWKNCSGKEGPPAPAPAHGSHYDIARFDSTRTSKGAAVQHLSERFEGRRASGSTKSVLPV